MQIWIGDGAFGGEQCLGDVHLHIFKRFHTCAQQIEEVQIGAQFTHTHGEAYPVDTATPSQ